ncbi:glyoxalase [Streptomyces sp. NWU339]|uniref:VOC family protein n=1 Tax=Streptomyces sp. NWU339 TaxID=2185284 RepID=UPI000D68153C|nr:VOC family protein [Streptomyces sp. NWU339]PWI04936.1 glyoxalase [Streptomyces sp. NWU339]
MTAVARLRSVVDCPGPREPGRFHAAAAGGTSEERDPDRVAPRIPAGPRPAFRRAPGDAPPDWPRAGHDSQRFHLDFDAGGTREEVDAAEQQVPAPGARVLERESPEEYDAKDSRVYADPAGHPFCPCRIEQP